MNCCIWKPWHEQLFNWDLAVSVCNQGNHEKGNMTVHDVTKAGWGKGTMTKEVLTLEGLDKRGFE